MKSYNDLPPGFGLSVWKEHPNTQARRKTTPCWGEKMTTRVHATTLDTLGTLFFDHEEDDTDYDALESFVEEAIWEAILKQYPLDSFESRFTKKDPK